MNKEAVCQAGSFCSCVCACVQLCVCLRVPVCLCECLCVCTTRLYVELYWVTDFTLGVSVRPHVVYCVLLPCVLWCAAGGLPWLWTMAAGLCDLCEMTALAVAVTASSRISSAPTTVQQNNGGNQTFSFFLPPALGGQLSEQGGIHKSLAMLYQQRHLLPMSCLSNSELTVFFLI
jgi:hypothetical protein